MLPVTQTHSYVTSGMCQDVSLQQQSNVKVNGRGRCRADCHPSRNHAVEREAARALGHEARRDGVRAAGGRPPAPTAAPHAAPSLSLLAEGDVFPRAEPQSKVTGTPVPLVSVHTQGHEDPDAAPLERKWVWSEGKCGSGTFFVLSTSDPRVSGLSPD